MKKIKRLGTLSALASLLVLLSGCVRVKDGKPYGMVYDYPTAWSMTTWPNRCNT